MYVYTHIYNVEEQGIVTVCVTKAGGNPNFFSTAKKIRGKARTWTWETVPGFANYEDNLDFVEAVVSPEIFPCDVLIFRAVSRKHTYMNTKYSATSTDTGFGSMFLPVVCSPNVYLSALFTYNTK